MSVREHFLGVFTFDYPRELCLNLLLCFEIWVPRTLVNQVALFLAAQAPVVVIVNRPIVCAILVFIVPELDVFGELAPQSILVRFATAPPHLARPLTVMRATRPVEVFLVFVVALTVPTHFATHVHPSVLLSFKFLDLSLNFIFLGF